MFILGIVMNCLSIFSMEPPMKSTETLRQLEKCYEAFHPADENTVDAFIWFSKIPHPFLNAVMHLHPDGNFEEKIDQIIQRAPDDLPYSIWVLSGTKYAKVAAYLEQKQFSPAMTCSLMQWSVEGALPKKSDIRLADPDIFSSIVANFYQFNDVVKRGFTELLGRARCENFLLYIDDRPVSTGTLIPCGYYGGIFNDAFLPGFEKQASTLIQHLMQRAYELRLQQLVVLSAPEYVQIYQDLGFEKTGEVQLYLPALKK